MSIKNPLAELFGTSPIKPMQEHMSVSVSAAIELSSFLVAAYRSNWEEAEASYNSICDIEHKADELKKDIRLHLPKSLFLPVPRSDLLELLTMQDKIANKAKDISGLMLGRKMAIPQTLQPTMLDFVNTSIATAKQALTAINELDELLESGFSGHELVIVERLVEELNALERQADTQEVQVRSELFQLESELPPVDVMFMYRIIEWIGDLADRSEKVGSRLLLLLAR